MSVAIQCGNCGKQYALADDAIGRRVKCKQCGNVFTAEHPDTAKAAAAATPPPPPTEEADPFAGFSQMAASTPPPVPGLPKLPPAPPPPAALRGLPTPVPYSATLNAPPQSREERPIRPASGTSLDPLSPILILAWVVIVLGCTGYVHSQIPDAAPEFVRSFATKSLWSHAVGRLVVLWIFSAPAMLLGMFVASKLCRFELPMRSYVRSAGLMAMFEGLLMLRGFLGASAEGTVNVLLFIAAALLAGVVAKVTFELLWREAGVAVLTSAIPVALGYGIALYSNSYINASITISSLEKEFGGSDRSSLSPAAAEQYDEQRSKARSELAKKLTNMPWPFYKPTEDRRGPNASPPPEMNDPQLADRRPSPLDPDRGQQANTPSRGNPTPATPIAPPPPPDPAEAAVSRVTRAMAMSGDGSADFAGPDASIAALEAVAKDLATARTSFPANANLTRLEADLNRRLARLRAMPPKSPPRSLLTSYSAKDAMPSVAAAPKLGEPVYFGGFIIRVPADARIEIRAVAGQVREELEYQLGNGQERMFLKMIPRTHPEQKQVWVKTKHYQATELDGEPLFTLEALNEETPVRMGLINGVPFVRVTKHGSLIYAAPSPEGWLQVTVNTFGGRASAEAFEAAIRTFRPATMADKKVSPYNPAAVASQFPNHTSEVGAIFRQSPAESEPFVIQYLSHPNVFTRREAAALLPVVASVKSVPQLKDLMKSEDKTVAEAAKAALRAIAPSEVDDLGELLAKMKTDGFGRRDALEKLAAMPADPKRRNEVAAVLEEIVLNDKGFDQDSAAKALVTWAGDKTSLRLSPLLNNPNLFGRQRNILITALSGCRDKAAAAVILKWISLETDDVIKAMRTMGPVAEDEVIRIFNQQFTLKTPIAVKARTACVTIMGEIGTAKSLEPLGRASRDPRDAALQASAKIAIDTVKARMADAAAAKAATKPTTAPVR